jgi:hypothetical protein
VKKRSLSRTSSTDPLLIAMGDSIMWGQGLNRQDKICYKVGKKLNLDVKGVCNLAHSGAAAIARGVRSTPPITDPDYFSQNDVQYDRHRNDEATGEVPRANPTVLEQAMFYKGDVSAVRYILIDGSINDVQILNILNPLFDENQLKRLIDQHCYREMTVLLKYVASKFTGDNCKIVVVGYFPILSPKSRPEDVASFLLNLSWKYNLPKVAPQAMKLRALSMAFNLAVEFWHKSDKALQAAVANVGDRRVRCVSSGLSYDNALFTAEPPFLREPRLVPGHALDPVDDVRYEDRLKECKVYPAEDAFGALDCNDASLGHPTELGAEVYASQILSLLQNWKR